MSSLTTAHSQPQPPTRAARTSGVGRAAGLLVVALGLGSLVGAVWGVLRPGYDVVVEDGQLVVNLAASPVNVEFDSYGWFAVLTSLLGVLLALIAFAFNNGRATAFVLLWVVVTSFAGAFAIYTFGMWSTGFVSDKPGHEGLVDGSRLRIVPALQPGVVWLVGPYMSVVTYWLLAFASPEPEQRER
ncbi:hypothetical protein [Corynebacterium mayonis]|uniref:hypothetical protein n=1 Tax=Corynebacterium mayonis TaxID=3062461 RepID=UPI003140B4A5